MNGHRVCFFEEKQRCLPVFIPLQKLNCFLLFWRWSFPLLGYLASSSVFHNSSLRNLTRNSTGAFILGLKNGWVMCILQLGFCSLHLFQSLGWLFYTPESFARYGSMINRKRVPNRFEHVMLFIKTPSTRIGIFLKKKIFLSASTRSVFESFSPTVTRKRQNDWNTIASLIKHASC